MNALTPAMKQYWNLKKDAYDKIFFFKHGYSYDIFFEDAVICHRLLDLPYHNYGKKMSIGFLERNLDKYAGIVVNAGYKVVVIDQTETYPQAIERAERENLKKTEICTMREVSAVITKGTYMGRSQTFEPKFILAYKQNGNVIGVTFFDVTTLQIFVGQFVDDECLTTLRTLITQIRPIEVIY